MHIQPTPPGIRVSLAELIEMRHRVREVQLFSTPARRSPLIGLHHSKLRGRGVDFEFCQGSPVCTLWQWL